MSQDGCGGWQSHDALSISSTATVPPGRTKSTSSASNVSGRRHVDHDQPLVREIEGAILQAACHDICLQHRDIAQVTPGNLVLCHVREARLSLESDNDAL